jgi:hypothetical protein
VHCGEIFLLCECYWWGLSLNVIDEGYHDQDMFKAYHDQNSYTMSKKFQNKI